MAHTLRLPAGLVEDRLQRKRNREGRNWSLRALVPVLTGARKQPVVQLPG